MKFLIECVPICQIDVPARQQNLGDLEGLMASLREIILSEMEMILPKPIVVTRNRSRFWLNKDLDRYYARKYLGWAATPAIVLEVEDLYEELAKIAERLSHRELTTLECADLIIQQQQLLDALPPWARPGTGPRPGRGKKPRKKISDHASSAGLKKKPTRRAIQKPVNRSTNEHRAGGSDRSSFANLALRISRALRIPIPQLIERFLGIQNTRQSSLEPF
jgi:hypothetical protein